MRNKIIAVMCACMLTACAPTVMVKPVIAQKASITIPSAQPMTLYPVNWRVLDNTRLKELLKEAETSKKEALVFALDENNLNNNNLNQIEIERYIKEQKQIINTLTLLLNPHPTQTAGKHD